MRQRDEWFQHDRWGEVDQQEFFKRLAKCGHPLKKLQYLEAKADHLFDSGDPEKQERAIELHRRASKDADAESITGNPKDAKLFRQWAKNAILHVAERRYAQGRMQEAEVEYRVALSREAGAPDPYIVRLARLVIARKGVEEYTTLLDLIHASFERYKIVLAIIRPQLFEYACVQALLASALGRADAAHFAQSALAVAAAPDHGIGATMRLGVTDAKEAEIRLLKQIAMM
jgi:hypothetical protein